MSQEIQLSFGQQPVPAPSPFPQGGALAVVPQTQAPLVRIHQHLRGRYFLTALLAAIFAVAGAAAGFLLPRPAYQSTGLIEIDPVVPTPDLADKIMPMYQQYVGTVIAKIHSDRVMRQAMNEPAWLAHRSNNDDALVEFSKNLTLKFAPSAATIQITYTDDRKDARAVCPVAVTSIIKAYQELYGKEDDTEFAKKRALWVRKANESTQQITAKKDVLNSLLGTNGNDLQLVFGEKMRESIVLEQQLTKASNDLKQQRDELQKAQAQAGSHPYTVEELAQVNLALAEMYRINSQLELEVQELETRYGKNNLAAAAARERLTLRVEAMKKYAQHLSEQYFIQWKPEGGGGVLIPRDLSVTEAAVKRLQDQYNDLKQTTDDLSRRSHQADALKSELADKQTELNFSLKKIEELDNQKEMAETFKVVDPRGTATIANDRRIAFSALGTLVGGALPVGLLLLASLMNPRFRFSDDAAAEPTTGGLTLLGILPDLPDRLSDPEQASIAAHCVHQIRTMLQINNNETEEERRVIAVTSAAPGDGKTSLTLALGLSYAACGTRTLLIDCDLIGAGLTSRMNINAAEGVLEAISHRTLLEYVRSTDIADVAILPVGTGQSLHASTLSPAALRRLIEEAKKHFDTILIDTGPVLGSIEASLVAAAVDAVVLTVSRGQPRPVVERAIAHLKNINARLAGVVFNRAQSADFDRSISGISLRSASKGTGHNSGPRMGPVARAVQSAFEPLPGNK